MEVELNDRKLLPEQALAELPRVPGEVEADSYAGDVRWLLERLRDGSGVRINCGGEDFIAPGGAPWGHDRFFQGGEEIRSDDVRIDGAPAEALYRRMRAFPLTQDESLWGYLLPVPRGRYRVSLHFAEIGRNVPGWRRFDVWVQGQEVLTDLDVVKAAGFRKAVVRNCDVELTGGALSIRFAYRLRKPMVSAIEIQKLD